MDQNQHQSLKRAFLFSPLGDIDSELIKRLKSETGMRSDEVRHWFKVTRKRMNLTKFVGAIENDDIIFDEAVTDEIRKSGKSPLDILVDFSRVNFNDETDDSDRNIGIGDDIYDDSGNFDEEEFTIDSSFENESEVIENEEEIKIKPEPGVEFLKNQPDSEIGNIKEEPVVEETEQFQKKQPDPDIGNIKEEQLSVEEKAKKYDQMKLEIDGLQKQMEEMRRRLESQKPVEPQPPGALPIVKKEPGFQNQLSQPQYQQYQIVNTWQQQSPYPNYSYQYPAQPYILPYQPQQQYQFQPQQFTAQYQQPRGIVLQYQGGLNQQQTIQQQQLNPVQFKEKAHPKKFLQPLKPKNH